MKAIALSMALVGFSATAVAADYSYSGVVNAVEMSSHSIEIDYQEYQLTPQSLVIGASKRGEHGAELTLGQEVEFNTTPGIDGPPLITEIRVTAPAGQTQ